MTNSPKIIAVFGATGRQGNAICRSLLKSKQKFVVRAITRNAESDAAQHLARLGAQVVVANGYHDEQMLAALTGAWAFYLNTNRHDQSRFTLTGELDERFGRRLVTLAAQAGVKVLVHSTCESPSEFTNGKAPVAWMDAKRKVELFARSLPQFDSVIGAFPGWTFDLYKQPTLPEFLGGFPLLPDNEGYITFRSPPIKGEGKMQTLSIDDDFGEMVHGMLLDPARWNHQTIQCLSDAFTYPELMEHFTEVTGKKARYIPVDSFDSLPTYGNPFLIELLDLYRYLAVNKGCFFGHPDNFDDCKSLKDAARKDKGLQPAPLATIRGYLVRHLGK